MRADTSNFNIAVRQLQLWLQFLSRINPEIPNAEPDGVFGPVTERAVSRFQLYCGLPPTGTVDYNTWVKLKAEYNSAWKNYNNMQNNIKNDV